MNERQNYFYWNDYQTKIDMGQAMIYQIRIKGHLGPGWTGWFEGMTIIPEEDGNTLLIGQVVDQAALHGLIKKVRDLGMPLISVDPVESGMTDAPDVKP